MSKKNETVCLEAFRVALVNVKSHELIALRMLEMGYNDAVLAEGKNLLNETLEKFQHKKEEDAEESLAYDRFEALWDEMDAVYRLHRKKAKVIFRKEPACLEKMAISGKVPKAYIKWIYIVKTFYGELTTDEQLQQKASRLKISPAEIQSSLQKLERLETSRATYFRKKGESQHATQVKEEAFTRLDTWMIDFYAVARIALDDSPQLLEALSKRVRG